jgi:hypothetical protein
MKQFADGCEADSVICLHAQTQRSIQADRRTDPSTASAHVGCDRNVKSSALCEMRRTKLQYQIINGSQFGCNHVFVLRLLEMGKSREAGSSEIMKCIAGGRRMKSHPPSMSYAAASSYSDFFTAML